MKPMDFNKTNMAMMFAKVKKLVVAFIPGTPKQPATN